MLIHSVSTPLPLRSSLFSHTIRVGYNSWKFLRFGIVLTMSRCYTVEERVTLSMLIKECATCADACETFHKIFPDRPKPTVSCCSKLMRKFMETGSVHSRPQIHRTRSVTGGPLVTAVQKIVAEDPKISIRNMAARLNTSGTSIHRVLKDKGFKRFKYSCLQKLTDQDYLSRISFCQWFRLQSMEQPTLPKDIFFSDEAIFHLGGVHNSRNEGYWSYQNQHVVKACKSPKSQKIMVWCGLHNSTVIGKMSRERVMSA